MPAWQEVTAIVSTLIRRQGNSRAKPPPSLDGFDVKVARARTHHQAIKEANRQVHENGLYRFKGEVLNGGLVHLYRVQHPPALDPQWSAIIGDCVHNLRAALDYLATQLVLVSGHTPNQQTYFPIMPSRPRSKRRFLRTFSPNGSGRPKIHGGVRDDILQVVDSVQPYQDTPLGRQLWRLHKLDVIDKHRQLLLAAMVPRVFGVGFNPAQHPVSSLQRTYTQLREITTGHDEPIFKITFGEPVHRLTPTRAYPLIAFRRTESEVPGLDADRVLNDLFGSLEEIRDLFARFLS
jgi:hypothetical protein